MTEQDVMLAAFQNELEKLSGVKRLERILMAERKARHQKFLRMTPAGRHTPASREFLPRISSLMAARKQARKTLQKSWERRGLSGAGEKLFGTVEREVAEAGGRPGSVWREFLRTVSSGALRR